MRGYQALLRAAHAWVLPRERLRTEMASGMGHAGYAGGCCVGAYAGCPCHYYRAMRHDLAGRA